MDAIPVFSQLKSLAQRFTGDSEGATKTQKNFLKFCPIVSQATSIVLAIRGDTEGALKVQKNFLKGADGMVNAVPVVGHVKGAVHYICGDNSGGSNAIKAATHSTGVIGGGIGGFLYAGPVGAAVLGAAGGALTDNIMLFGDIAINGKDAKPYGILENVINIVEDPTNGGHYVDAIGGLVLDGVTGYVAGRGIGEKIQYKLEENTLKKAVGKDTTKQIMQAGEKMEEIRYKHDIKSNKPHVLTEAKDLGTGGYFDGNNKQIRNAINDKTGMGNRLTELQKKVPNAANKMGRNPSTCAEHQAYNRLYQKRPQAAPQEIRSVSVRYDKNLGRPVTVKRCDNCKQFGGAMGSVPTDILPDGTPVPKEVNSCHVGVHPVNQTFEEEEEDDLHED